nr:glycoside hydrolase family 88 protein [Clostridia bacterium]
MKTLDLALNIFKHYAEIRKNEPSSYYTCVANFGLVELAEICGEGSEPYTMARELLKKYPDNVLHAKTYNFPSYRVSGIAKAKAAYLDINDDLDQIREYADEIMTARRDNDGIMSYPRGEENGQKVWIDVATAVTPFLIWAGLKLGEPKYIDEAANQTLKMYDLFMDDSCGLLHQARDFRVPGKISEDHWSRGNGWGIFPLAVLCQYLPDGHPEKQRCFDYLKAHALALIPYQSDNGMWRQEITVTEYEGVESYEETSGTGLIMHALSAGMLCGALECETFMPVFEKALGGLQKISIVKEDFGILNSCPGCLCPGDGSIRAYVHHKPTFKDEPHGAGPVIMALAAAHRLGITEIDF